MPEATNEADSELGDRLKSTLWYHVGQLVDEETINLGMNASPQYIGSLTELVWTQIGGVTLLDSKKTAALTLRRKHRY